MKEISRHSSLSLKNTNKCVKNVFIALIYLIFLFTLLCTRGEIPIADSEKTAFICNSNVYLLLHDFGVVWMEVGEVFLSRTNL